MIEKISAVEPEFQNFIEIVAQAWDAIFPGIEVTIVIDSPELLKSPALSTNHTDGNGGAVPDLPAILRRCAAELLEFADEKDTTSTPHEVVSE